MKKNPFLIDKKIILVDHQIEAIKGGKDSAGITCFPIPRSIITLCLDPNDTCTDGPDCDNSGG